MDRLVADQDRRLLFDLIAFRGIASSFKKEKMQISY